MAISDLFNKTPKELAGKHISQIIFDEEIVKTYFTARYGEKSEYEGSVYFEHLDRNVELRCIFNRY